MNRAADLQKLRAQMDKVKRNIASPEFSPGEYHLAEIACARLGWNPNYGSRLLAEESQVIREASPVFRSRRMERTA